MTMLLTHIKDEKAQSVNRVKRILKLDGELLKGKSGINSINTTPSQGRKTHSVFSFATRNAWNFLQRTQQQNVY